MNGEFARVLQALLGLPMWSVGRASQLVWFQFGGSREVKQRDGETKTVGDYGLHLQCTWRIIEHDNIVTGWSDRFFPGDDDDDEFDWERSKDTRCDRQIERFLSRVGQSFPVVTEVRVAAAGAFTLQFDRDISLEVFPDCSVDGECWRLFQPYKPTPHAVATSKDGHMDLILE